MMITGNWTGELALHTPVEHRSRQHDAAATTQTAQTNVGPYPINFPFVTPARVRLTHLHTISWRNFNHEQLIRDFPLLMIT